jgi:hypothetical protein
VSLENTGLYKEGLSIKKNIHMEPAFRKKHLAKDKKKDKGPVYASKKHVRIELENQWRHDKNITRNHGKQVASPSAQR